ncbi:MAG: methyltransferase domain-containing protein [Nitrospirota bacterium]
MKYLNIGCGNRFNKDWINIDFNSHHSAVTAHNLLEGIPLQDGHVEVVYQSHLLEHFPKDRAQFLLSECMRVLKPGGVLRIAVPDLEGIARAYLKSLEEARTGKERGDSHYEWMMVELLDQLIRQKSGGKMLEYLSAETIPAKDFIIKRLGVEASNIIDNATASNTHEEAGASNKASSSSFSHYLKKVIRCPGNWREYLLHYMIGNEYEALQLGRFRCAGEIHQWMYDNYSLKKALNAEGFTDIIQRSATESYIPDWQQFNLDIEPDGSIYKPDSLYMEGLKPKNIS